MPYAADTFLTPIILTPGTDNVLIVEEASNTARFVVTLHQDTTSTTAETWYLHDDESWHANYPGLLYAIKKLLNDGTTVGCGTISGDTVDNTYSWAVITPTGSTGMTNNGLQLRADSATNDFTLAWTDGSNTFNVAQVFGHPLNTPIADDDSSTSGSDEILSFAQTTRHRLVTTDIVDGAAIDKMRIPYKEGDHSSNRPSDRVSVYWDEGYRRRFIYDGVRGANVHEERGDQSEYATAVGRGVGDTAAIWFDIWDAFTDNREIICVHDSSDDLQVDTHSYEVLKLWNDTEWESFASRYQPAGDLHRIEFEAWVNETYATYKH